MVLKVPFAALCKKVCWNWLRHPLIPRKAHTVCVRKAGVALGEKGNHICGYLDNGDNTLIAYNPKRDVAV